MEPRNGVESNEAMKQISGELWQDFSTLSALLLYLSQYYFLEHELLALNRENIENSILNLFDDSR